MIGFTSISARSRGVRRFSTATAALIGAWMGMGAPGGAVRHLAPTGRAMAQGGAESPTSAAAASPVAWIPDAWWTMPDGFGVFAGLVVLSIATVVGFWQLAGAHQRRMRHRVEAHRRIEIERRDARARALAGAFAGEVEAIKRECTTHLDYTRERVNFWIEDSRKKNVSPEKALLRQQPRGLYPVLDMPVFDAISSDIAALGSPLTSELAQVRHIVAAWRREEQGRPRRTVQVYVDALLGLGRQVAFIEHTAKRLKAFEEGHPLPERPADMQEP